MNAQTKIERADNVHSRLSEARQRFHQVELKKSGNNTFAGYRYFELGDFIIPALGIFDEVGLSAVVSFGEQVATMTIHNMDAPDQTITITSPMGSAKLKACHEVQNIGAVETYQRRYLWTTALEIVEHDALEATTGDKSKAPETADKPTEAKKVFTGKHKSLTALKTAMRGFVHELNGCGDGDELSAFLATPDALALVKQVETDMPDWWNGYEGQPAEFVPLSDMLTRRSQECAAKSAEYATG